VQKDYEQGDGRRKVRSSTLPQGKEGGEQIPLQKKEKEEENRVTNLTIT